MAVIRKSFETLDVKSLCLLYKAMVRPLIEYGNVVWGPSYIGDQMILERVQKRATKLVPELRHLPYQDRLKKLKLPSLVYRRRRGDMIAVFAQGLRAVSQLP